MKKTISYLFESDSLSDTQVGVISLFASIFVLCACLVVMVKLLHALLRGKLAEFIHRVVNGGKWTWYKGYLAMD